MESHFSSMSGDIVDLTRVSGASSLILFGLMTLSYVLSTLWDRVGAPLLFFREEVTLLNTSRLLCAQIDAIPSSELARKGRLQREGVAVKKKLQEVEMKHWRYSLSLTSLFFLFKVEKHQEGLERTPLGKWFRKHFSSSAADLADHVFLLLFYNFPTVFTYLVYVVPSILYVLTHGGFWKVVAYLPVFLWSAEEERGMKGMPCPAWMWLVLCALSLKLVTRVWLSRKTNEKKMQ